MTGRAWGVTLTPGDWSYSGANGTVNFTVDADGNIGAVSLTAVVNSSWFGQTIDWFIPASKITQTETGLSGEDNHFVSSSIGWYSRSGSISATKVSPTRVTGTFHVGASDSSPHAAGGGGLTPVQNSESEAV